MLERLAQPFIYYEAEHRNPGQKISVVSAVTGMPGASNLLLFPFEAVNSVRTIHNARRIQDTETMIDGVIRTISIPFMIGNGFGVSYDLMTEVHLIQPHFFAFASLLGTVAGIILCGLEIIIESLNVFQAGWFGKQINKKLMEESFDVINKPPEQQFEYLKKVAVSIRQNKEAYTEIFGHETCDLFEAGINQKITQHKNGTDQEKILAEIQTVLGGLTLSYIQSKYLQVSKTEREEIRSHIEKKFPELSERELADKTKEAIQHRLAGKKSMLGRRISPWLAEMLENKILPTLKDLSSQSPGRVERGVRTAQKLIRDIHMQIDKKKLIHGVGIACLAVLIVALSISTGGVPIAAVLTVYGIGFSLALTRFILYKGLLKSHTWQIEWKKVPPRWCNSICRAFSRNKPKQAKPLPKITPLPKVRLKKQVPFLDRYDQWRKLDPRILPYI